MPKNPYNWGYTSAKKMMAEGGAVKAAAKPCAPMKKTGKNK